MFPKEDLIKWKEAFGCFLVRNRPFKQTFNIFRSDIEHALEQINAENASGYRRPDFIDTLGQHLFTYYLWGIYPLTGKGSLLQRFYSKTKGDKKHWAHLFDHVGRSLKKSDKQLTDQSKRRVLDFFEWRIKSKEPSELKEFTFWLNAECLEAEWRLKSYSRLLDVYTPEFGNAYLEVDALLKMRGEHTALVIECFAKLVDLAAQNNQMYIQTDKAKSILQTGLASNNSYIQEKAKAAREKLLQRGHFELWDREDG